MSAPACAARGASRAALCGDVETAGRIINAETLALSRLTARDKVKDIVQFAVSERFQKVRERLGLLIE